MYFWVSPLDSMCQKKCTSSASRSGQPSLGSFQTWLSTKILGYFQFRFYLMAIYRESTQYLNSWWAFKLQWYFFVKVHIFWEGHKILQNLHQLFDWQYIGQTIGRDFEKICGLLRIYELYYYLCIAWWFHEFLFW